MNKDFLKLLNELKLDHMKSSLNGTLKSVHVDEENNIWIFDIVFPTVVDITDFLTLEKAVDNYPKVKETLKHACLRVNYDEVTYNQVEEYYNYVLSRLASKKPRFNALIDFDIEQNNENITLVCPKDAVFVDELLDEIVKEMKRIGFDINLSKRFCEKAPLISDQIKSKDELFQNTVNQKSAPTLSEINFVPYKNNVIRNVKNKIMDIPKTEIELIEYKSMHQSTSFSFEGEISKVEYRLLNNGNHLYTFIISDENDSIYVKKFVKDKDEKKYMDECSIGMFCKVKGNAAFDTFSDEVTVTALMFVRSNIAKPKDLRHDLEKDKRIEFRLHSKMSTMDGITSISEYVETAKKWGHNAIAITDKGNVQAFPEMFKATKDRTIKPIYGVEFSFINEKDLEIVKNATDQKLTDLVYTVFDIETTGLSVNYDKIIEISAIKIKNNQIIDKFETFINPEQSLSNFTTKLTSITNQDVKSAPLISEVIPKFKAFIDNTVLVAHNAHFDVGFIYKTLKDHHLFDAPYPTIDTLSIARCFYGDKLNRFNLKAVAKYFKVELSQHHRAIYDTTATMEIFLHMIRDAREIGIRTLADWNKIAENADGYKYAIGKKITLLVKNQKGLKNLYEIVSDANTTHFYKEPRLLKSVLDRYRDNLLIGSGCMDSYFFEIAMNKEEEELEQLAKYYDYLEIQPPSDFNYLKDEISDIISRVTDTYLKIIKIGKKLNKPVIASGDVYHLLKSESRYREIYVASPLVGGGMHSLARYKEIPSQYFRTTEEMLEEFSFLDDETRRYVVIDAPNELASSIEFVKAFTPELYAPSDDFLALEGIPSIQNKLIQMVHDRSHELYGEKLPKIVEDRLEKEIRSITENKFSTVYYISHLLVKKSLDEGYLVGSRGSVGSSLVATMMNITEVNPLPPHYVCPKCRFSSFKMTELEKIKYGVKKEEEHLQVILDKYETGFDLPDQDCPICNERLKKDGHSIPFETFLGFKGDKVPDIDLNFSGDYQPVVHEYIREIFGVNRAFRAGTISTVAEKTAFGYVRGYLEKRGKKMRKAEMERIAQHITGVKRTTGQHPGGIVVVPSYKDITDITPIQYPSDDISASWRTTHFDYHSFEDNLFKLDVLGHDDPTMIRYLMDYVKAHPLEFPFTDARDIPLDDKNVYSMLSSTESIGLSKDDINSEVASFGIPEMGTSFVREMLKDSKPTTFAEIVKISGLSHGTDVWLNNAKDLVTGKTSFGKIPFHDVIGCRDDIMVYLIQNNMEEATAFEISEFIRKGKAAKNKDQWDGYKIIMKQHKIPDWYIWSCGKIKYMFPKAHATAYVMMALRIAWFKYYKPIVFYSAYFSKRVSDYDYQAFVNGEYGILQKMDEITKKGNQASDTEKRLFTVLEIALEMVKRGYGFLPIDLEKSAATDFLISDDKKHLILPFITVDGLGGKVAKSIVKARNDAPFKSKEDVLKRTSLSKTLFAKLDMLDVFKYLPENLQMNIFDL